MVEHVIGNDEVSGSIPDNGSELDGLNRPKGGGKDGSFPVEESNESESVENRGFSKRSEASRFIPDNGS